MTKFMEVSHASTKQWKFSSFPILETLLTWLKLPAKGNENSSMIINTTMKSLYQESTSLQKKEVINII